MKTKFTKLFAITLTGALLTACTTREEITPVEEPQASAELTITQKQAIKKETALLVGRALRDKTVRDYVINEMKDVSEDGEVVSFSYLTGRDKSLRKNEVEKFKKKKTTAKTTSENIFDKAIQQEFERNPKDYKNINDLYEAKKAQSITARVPADDLTGTLIDGQQLYMPYNETYSASYVPATYYTSEEMLDGSPTNSGYYFDGYVERYISSMDNNFIDSKPTFIVSETDPCDVAGGTCSSIELTASSGNFNPINNTPQLLISNINHTEVNDENYLLSSKIPRIRINGTSWMGFGGTHQKLVFMRGSYDTQNVSVGTNGIINATGYKEVIGEFRTKRKNAKYKYWLDFNKNFDTDWRMGENEQALAVFSQHHLAATGSITVSPKVGLKYNFTTNKIEPTAEATFGVNLQLSFGSTKFRSNASQSRKYNLAYNVGPGLTGKTYNYNGIDWNVKDLGIVEYFYNHYTLAVTN